MLGSSVMLVGSMLAAGLAKQNSEPSTFDRLNGHASSEISNVERATGVLELDTSDDLTWASLGYWLGAANAGDAEANFLQTNAPAIPVVATRLRLAAVCCPSSGAIRQLTESGREGVFVFSASDLSAEVASDPQQGLYVPPENDPSGASGAWVRRSGEAINPEWFGLSAGADQSHNTAALQAAVNAALAMDHRLLRVPAKDFQCGHIIINGSNLTVDMSGATLRGTGVRIETTRTSSHITISGGHLVEEIGAGSYLFNFRGTDIAVDGTIFEKAIADDSYHGYIRRGTERIRMANFQLILADDGIYIEGKDHVFADFVISGERGGNADDSFAIKGIGGATENIEIGPGIIRDMYDIVGIGSEIGTEGEDDAAYSGRVSGVRVHDIEAERLTYAIFIKPGGVAEYDYRSGLVEDITLENITVHDPTGAKFRKGIAIYPGRNSIVRRVTARNVVINARAAESDPANKNVAVDILAQAVDGDYRGTGPRMSDIDLEVLFSDPYDGAPNGEDRPGYPMHHIASVDVDDGRIEDVTLRIDGNGSQEAGISVAPSAGDAVRIEKAHLRNVSRNPTFGIGGMGGIAPLANIALGQDIEIAPPAPGNGYAIGGLHPLMRSVSYSGPAVRQQDLQLGTMAAGRSSTRPLFTMPADAVLLSAEIVVDDGIAVDATNYTRLRLNAGDATLAELNTSSTEIVARTPTRMHGSITIADPDALFVGKGSLLSLEKMDFGTGTALAGAHVRLRYVPFASK